MWHAISVVYYGENLVAALKEPLKEAVARLRHDLGISRIMLLPRWKFGPHLDLVVECEVEHFDADVLPLCHEIFGRWMASMPSTTQLDPGEYEALSQRLAIVELESGPFLPLLPNNTVLRSEYAASRALKLPEIAREKEVFLCQTLDLTFDLLEVKQQEGNRFLLLLVAMMAVLGQTYRQGGLSRGYLSYRSHAEYFFAMYDSPAGALRSQFDRLDRSVTKEADAIVRAVCAERLDDLPLPTQQISILRRWADIVADTARAMDRIIAVNHEAMLASDTFERLAHEAADHVPAQMVETLRQRPHSSVALAMEQEEGRQVLDSVEFMSYRTTVNFFYYLLPLAGISPMKKFCLCHISANTTERVLGTSWQHILGITHGEETSHATSH